MLTRALLWVGVRHVISIHKCTAHIFFIAQYKNVWVIGKDSQLRNVDRKPEEFVRACDLAAFQSKMYARVKCA